jgi:hypothetical protein
MDRTYILLHLCISIPSCPFTVLFQTLLILIYHALVESVISYGITIWGWASDAHIKKIEYILDRTVLT